MMRDTSAQDRLIDVSSHARRRRWWLLGGGVALLAAIAFLVPTLQRAMSVDASVSASRLSFATVKRGKFVRDVAAEGRVVAAVSPTLYARSEGDAELRVKAGDSVKKGQVLAVIDSPELSNKLLQEESTLASMNVDYQRAKIDARKQRQKLEATFENAQIDAASAKTDFGRYQAAYKAGAMSQSDVDHARNKLDKETITLKHAREDMDLNRHSLGFDVKAKKLLRDRQALLVKDYKRQVKALHVVSPVNGQVGQVFIAPHAAVARNDKLLSVIDLSALQVKVQVPESFARDLGVGMPAQVSGSGTTWQGAVAAISPEVVKGQVAARVRFTGNKPGQLRQNQRLSVRILLDHQDNALIVDRGSFVDESGGRYAYVVRDGVAVKTPVQLGPSSIDKVEILKGLKPGDKVVISGTDNFNGAARVAISQ